MPKMKSHSGAKKRFFITKKGKVKHKQPGQRHLLTGDTGAHDRKLRKGSYLNKTNVKIIRELLPYS